MFRATWAHAFMALLMLLLGQAMQVQRLASNLSHPEVKQDRDQMSTWSLEEPDAAGAQLALTMLPVIRGRQ